MKKHHVPSFLSLIWQAIGVIFVTMAFYSVIQVVGSYHGLWRSPVLFRTLSEIFLTLSIIHCLALLRNYLIKTIPDNRILSTINKFLRLDSNHELASIRIASHLVGTTVAFLLSLIVLRSIDPMSRLLGFEYFIYARSLSGVQWALGIAAILGWYFFVRSMVIKAMRYGSLPDWVPHIFLIESSPEIAYAGGPLGILRRNLTIRLLLYAFGILVFVEVVTSFFPFRDVDSQVARFIDWKIQRKASEPNVAVITLKTKDKNVKNYLSFTLKMVADLKQIGAKTVVIDYGAARYLGTQTQIEIAKKFEAEDIAVLGVDRFSEGEYQDSLGRNIRWPLFKAYRYGVMPEYNESGVVRRILLPQDYLEFNFTCELLKRYASDASSTEFQPESYGLRYGYYHIPLDEYSFFLVDMNARHPIQYFPFAAKEESNGELRYVKNAFAPVSQSVEISSFSKDFKGKIVFIHWYVTGEWMSMDEWNSFLVPIYGIADILAQHCLESSRWGHLPLLLCLLLLSVVLCRFFPARYAILFLIVITVGALYFCSWLFQSQSVLIHTSSVLFSLVLVSAILPAVRLANDIRSSEQKLN